MPNRPKPTPAQIRQLRDLVENYVRGIENRTKEVGVRSACAALRRQIVRLPDVAFGGGETK